MSAVEMPGRALTSICSCEVDRALANGAEPTSDTLLACRASQISIAGQRPRLEQLAARLEAGPAGVRGISTVAVLAEDSDSAPWDGRRAADLVCVVTLAAEAMES